MTRQCIGRMADGSRCLRAPAPTSDGGTVHFCCEWCEERALHEAFGTGWHDDARAHNLRPAIVGGLPIESPDPAPGASDQTPSPQGLIGRVPRSAGAPLRHPDARAGAGRVEVPARAPSASGVRSVASVATMPVPRGR